MGKQKNILLIMSDEQRTDTLGCYGNPRAHTPHLDALAREGGYFENCITPYPLCCPARASLWSGALPHQHHVVANWFHIREDLRAGGMVQDFANAGYHTLYVGKWHVPGTTPQRLGFSRRDAVPAVLEGRDRGRYIEDYRRYAEAKGYPLIPGNIENLTPNDETKRIGGGAVHCGTSDIPLEDYLETWQTARFLERMAECPEDQPFFAVCSYNAPHFPMLVPAPYDRQISPEEVLLPDNFCKGTEGKPGEVMNSRDYLDTKDFTEEQWRSLIAHYWGFCSLIDDQVGRIVRWLKEQRKYEDTILVFLSDHGDMIGSHALNHKSGLMQYEETLRVPLVMRGPGLADMGRKEMIVSLADVLPTLAGLCRVPIRKAEYGQSFAAVLPDGEDHFRSYAVSEGFANCHNGNGRYEDPRRYTAGENRPMVLAIRTPQEKYIFHQADIEEYYLLDRDPGENENLAKRPEVKERLRTLRQLALRQLEDTPALRRLAEERMRQLD